MKGGSQNMVQTTLSHAMFLIPDSTVEGRKGNAEGRVQKGQCQCRNDLSGYRVDLLMAE